MEMFALSLSMMNGGSGALIDHEVNAYNHKDGPNPHGTKITKMNDATNNVPQVPPNVPISLPRVDSRPALAPAPIVVAKPNEIIFDQNVGTEDFS